MLNVWFEPRTVDWQQKSLPLSHQDNDYFLSLPAYSEIEDWVVSTHWDTDVTHGALRFMNQVNTYRTLILYIFITVSGIHAFTGLLLIIGACLPPSPKGRTIFLPWLTLDMFFIVLTTALFVSWAFLSFFVHILVAIFFPVVSGALLGLWIYSWRNVREHFIVCGQLDDIDVVKSHNRNNHSGAMYRKLPPSSQSPTAELRTVNNYGGGQLTQHMVNQQHPGQMHRHQVPVWQWFWRDYLKDIITMTINYVIIIHAVMRDMKSI